MTAAAYGASGDGALPAELSGHGERRDQTEYAVEAARAVSGDVRHDAPLVMGGEDFSFMLNARPGAYILVGNGDTAMVHHPEYNFNDEAIPAGCSFWAEIVERRMPAS